MFWFLMVFLFGPTTDSLFNFQFMLISQIMANYVVLIKLWIRAQMVSSGFELGVRQKQGAMEAHPRFLMFNATPLC